MAAHRYWRLNITANNGNATVGLMSLYLRTDKYTENLGPPVYNGTYTSASSTAGPNSNISAERAFTYGVDDATYRWEANASTTGWLKIDYGAGNEKTIWYYAIRIDNSWIPLNKAPNSWQLQYSNDNINWTTLDSQSSVTWSAAMTKEYYIQKPWEKEKPPNSRSVVRPLKVNGNAAIRRAGI